MNTESKLKSNLFFALIASLTLGLAPFVPEPHIVGKISWVMGGATGMTMMDYWDLLMHGLPWLFLIYYIAKFIKHKTSRNNMEIQTILQDPQVNIIDVRELSEFNQGSLPNAIHIPLSVFGNHIDQIRNMKGPKVLFCRSGNRSGQAVSALQANGIDNCHNGGGIKQMEDSLLPVL